jgi:flagellar biosynthesis protein FlhB
MSEERSEKASEQRKKKSRDKGEGVRSRELNAAFAMMAGILVLAGAARRFIPLWATAYREMLSALGHTEWTPESLLDACRILMLPALGPVALVMGAAFCGALLSGMAQSGGVQFHVEALAFKPARLNPWSNIKQIASARALVRLGKSLVPASIVLILGITCLHGLMDPMAVLSNFRLMSAFSASYTLLLNAAWLMVAWAGFDYMMEWRSWNQRLKMSKQELREEHKEAAGDPQVKGRIRQIQRAMRKRRVKADISRATVVIVNPTHFAVALEFSFETMQPPLVLAKGRDLHAHEIREEARWAGVPIVENPPLARSLYRSVKVGRTIPFELYAAVAGILAYLYRQQAERASHRRYVTPATSGPANTSDGDPQ